MRDFCTQAAVEVEISMAQCRTPDKRERELMARNGLKPEDYGVVLAGEGYLILLCYRTRDTIRIDRGDRKWPR